VFGSSASAVPGNRPRPRCFGARPWKRFAMSSPSSDHIAHGAGHACSACCLSDQGCGLNRFACPGSVPDLEPPVCLFVRRRNGDLLLVDPGDSAKGTVLSLAKGIRC